MTKKELIAIVQSELDKIQLIENPKPISSNEITRVIYRNQRYYSYKNQLFDTKAQAAKHARLSNAGHFIEHGILDVSTYRIIKSYYALSQFLKNLRRTTNVNFI